MTIEWIAVDWGTTRLRAWAMNGDKPVAETSGDHGMGTLTSDQYEPALLSLIETWLGDHVTPVITCGMVGAREGWAEAAYQSVPSPPPFGTLTKAPTRDPRLAVYIIPGLSQSRPADVMRGEETQIAGFLSKNPKFDGVLCLPGTHTKWAHISAEEIVSFRTFMTGELFGLLTTRSVLRHSIGAGLDKDAFAEAIGDAMAKPEAIAARLFSLRAESLLTGLTPDTARARCSGYLIGMELAAARAYWLGRNVAVIGTPQLSSIYGAALATQGIVSQHFEGDTMNLCGLVSAYRLLRT